jgi:hypothetical protein
MTGFGARALKKTAKNNQAASVPFRKPFTHPKRIIIQFFHAFVRFCYPRF